ncbi:MAG TPA: hypothetical protein VNU68_01530 [Verrucomicrobiae bacterium]|nr:hypothetical protein [Verrucomicrobiae bacterium]
MAGPAELLIIAGVFAVIGTFLYVASRFLRGPNSETPKTQSTPSPAAAPTTSARPREAHAH